MHYSGIAAVRNLSRQEQGGLLRGIDAQGVIYLFLIVVVSADHFTNFKLISCVSYCYVLLMALCQNVFCVKTTV